jgi:hypothetical protein
MKIKKGSEFICNRERNRSSINFRDSGIGRGRRRSSREGRRSRRKIIIRLCEISFSFNITRVSTG